MKSPASSAVAGGSPITSTSDLTRTELSRAPRRGSALSLPEYRRLVGVAPLGVSLTEDQATRLAALRRSTGVDPILATDRDAAGIRAAERTFWVLTPHGLEPRYALLPAGDDPASLLTNHGPSALANTISAARPMADHLIAERTGQLANLSRHGVAPDAALADLMGIVAAVSPGRWDEHVIAIAGRLDVPEQRARSFLLAAVDAWAKDPRGHARTRALDLVNPDGSAASRGGSSPLTDRPRASIPLRPTGSRRNSNPRHDGFDRT